MQQPTRTVIFGEAPEESDSEEIELNNEDCGESSSTNHQYAQQTSSQNKPSIIPDDSEQDSQQATKTSSRSGIFGSYLFASIGSSSSSTLAKLAKYSPYELLSSSIGQPKLITTMGKTELRPSTDTDDSLTTSSIDGNINQFGKQAPQQLPPLHRTLYTKNYQFRASMIHLHKHPLQAAAKGVHSMSQCLVNDQKIIQEVNNAMIKIQREQKNLDMEISMIL